MNDHCLTMPSSLLLPCTDSGIHSASGFLLLFVSSARLCMLLSAMRGSLTNTTKNPPCSFNVSCKRFTVNGSPTSASAVSNEHLHEFKEYQNSSISTHTEEHNVLLQFQYLELLSLDTPP